MSRLVTCFILILSLSLSAMPLRAETATSGMSPAEAKRAIEVLQDDQRRADVVVGLKAVAAQADDSEAPAAEAELPIKTVVPLEADGLIVKTLRQVGLWADGWRRQMAQAREATRELPAWFHATFDDPQERHQLVMSLFGLALIFVIGCALEWGLRRGMKRLREALLVQARTTEAKSRKKNLQIKEAALAEQPASNPEDMALVQTVRDGVEQVEAIPVAAEAPPVIPESEQDNVIALPADNGREARNKASMRWHGTVFGHLPYAFAALLIDLLPLLAFMAVSGLLVRIFSADSTVVAHVMAEFAAAYVLVRLVMAVVRALFAPEGNSLSLIRTSPRLGQPLRFWLACTVSVAAFGIALADTLLALGGGEHSRLVMLKLTSLLAHLSFVLMILRIREPVAKMIHAGDDTSGAWAAVRNWLAQMWAPLSIILVVGIWFVWALGVENGFPKLVNFLAISAGIIILGRVAAILLLGALSRVFEASANMDNGQQKNILAERFYPISRWTVSILVSFATVIALLESWGIDALSWFAAGSIGRSLTSAILTILVAVIGAIVIWQTANIWVEKRLQAWQQTGDYSRAARLRTLLPMLRTGLFLAIALVVVLTALNQIGINTTPLLAGASIIGVAVGFGSQKLVQDFITGIFLLMENAMQVGDGVTVAGVTGTVENLSIRTVRLRASDGSLHIVPFSSVSTVNNTNRGIGNASIRVSVSYDSDIDEVTNELKRIGAALREDPVFKDLILSDIEIWGVDSVDGSMVTLAGQMRCIAKGKSGVQREINRRVLERFRKQGIEIANPRASVLVMADGATGGDS